MKPESMLRLIQNAEPISVDSSDRPVAVNISAGCRCCDKTEQMSPTPSQEEQRCLNWKLMLLLTIASASLICIVIISQQLIVRHLGGQDDSPVSFQINIPDHGWMDSAGLPQKLMYPGQKSEEFMVEIVSLDDKDDPVVSDTKYYKFEHEDEDVKFYSGLSADNHDGVTLIEDGVYWSKQVEDNIAPGLDDDIIQAELMSLRTRRVSSLDTPTWQRCGRDKNRFLTFSDGVHACARYREPDQQLVLGEVMSFYLARLLGLNNVPAVVLSQVDPNHPVWAGVVEDVTASDWRLGSMVALIQWIPELTRDRMPDILRQALMAGTTIDVTYDSEGHVSNDIAHVYLRDLSVVQAAELAQWSDMVVFDYITGNYDRIASMQDGAEKENRPEILSETVHNVVRSTATGSLWMIDNESGLLDAYNLLYPQSADSWMKKEAARFLRMHKDMLQTLCVFRRSTVNKVFSLYKQGDAVSLLSQFVSRNEPYFKEMMGYLQGQDKAWRKHFQERVEEVWTWMKQCQESVRYS